MISSVAENKVAIRLMEFPFTYRKWSAGPLLEELAGATALGLRDPQVYSPIHDKFFVLGESNCHVATFNNAWILKETGDLSGNILHGCVVAKGEDSTNRRDAFMKISPLVDPVKFATGKCPGDVDLCRSLPKWGDSDSAYPTSLDQNNIPYVDTFFTYLTSQLLHHHGFVNGLDYYGAIIGKQSNYLYNAIDDIECLEDSEYFNDKHGELFHMDDSVRREVMRHSAVNRPTLDIDEDCAPISLDVADIGELEEITVLRENITDGATDMEEVVQLSPAPATDSREVTAMDCKDDESDYCSSRSSDTEAESSDLDDDEDEVDGSAHDSGSEYDEDAVAHLSMHDYPVQLSFLEKCERTVDSLIVDEDRDLSEQEWESMILQLLMSLITYQKCFKLTHNDLHTNNVMYTETQKAFLYYKVNGRHYKVPTFGKIYKVIDFGRAIYWFRGQKVCSNSFAPDGDAGGQYNCEPFLVPEKPRLEPNLSFDLCRFATSLYDCVVGDEGDQDDWWPIIKLVVGWCKDDKKRNVLYKSNGEERYPDFKLYKMIARTVHNHVPEKVLQCSLFDAYVVGRKTINKSQKIMNIDTLPVYA